MGHHPGWKEQVPIPSEDVEPFAAMVIGKFWKRVEVAKGIGKHEEYNAMCTMWLMMDTLSALGTCIGTCTHFNVAMNNYIVMYAGLVQERLDIDPFKEPGWKW